MSPQLPTMQLTNDDLTFLQAVLANAGYTGDVWPPTNLSGKTLIGLFKGGMTDPGQLERELRRRFGGAPKTTLVQNALHKYAMSGIPASERIHTKVRSTSDLRQRLASSGGVPQRTAVESGGPREQK